MNRASPSGPFAPANTATLVAGVKAVTQAVPTDKTVVLSRVYGPTANQGNLSVEVAVDRLSFTIHSDNAADVGVIAWTLL
jgi:hypothetical protein